MARRALLLLSLVATLSLPAPARAQKEQVETLSCTVAYVIDGDSFNCRDGTKIRLLLVNAPESGPFGDLARRALVGLLPVGETFRIEFDREHLHQVMWNLLRNAARYARAEPGAIRLVLDGYADRVELSVLDNGPGVPASIQGQLFEPFFTTEAKGTGLGLYLARELCSANRATLEYVSDQGGAHFRIRCRRVEPK